MAKLKEVNLFVPGRISLVGELSDWVCEYKKENKDIIAGESIVTNINLGIHATVKKCSLLKYEYQDKVFCIEMKDDLLLKEAESYSYYSYICGVCLHMLRKYNVGGININIKSNTLPEKKGLSSSAAICILTVKAFSEIYNLKLSENEIMEDAYLSEHLALSQCGKLDQLIVKSNNKLTKATFHENCVSTKEISVKKEMNLVIADLNGNKDTRKILSSLRNSYPYAKTIEETAIHDMQEKKNHDIVKRMEIAIKNGSLIEVGRIMSEYQKNIDEAGIPICDEFIAPILHKTMTDPFIKKNSYGSKGMGSNGDGSIEILAKDKISQQKILDYLKDKLNMQAFKFDIKPTHKIKKAIIPVAGFGTRLYPISRAIKKAFMPIYDNGEMKPIVLKLIEDLDKVGIEKICLVIGPDDKEEFDSFFKKSLKKENLNKLSEENQIKEFDLLRIGEKIEYVIQQEQLGFGHAVYLCKEFAGNDPVLMILGDTYYTTKNSYSPIEQIINYYDEVEKNIIAIGEIEDDEISNVGIMSGTFDDKQKTKMSVNTLVEKPTIEYAKEHLMMDGVCYGNFGMWVIKHQIFDQIENNIENEIKSKGEYQFVDAIAQILNDADIKALKIDGESHDVGNINSYKKTLLDSFQEN